MSTITHLTHILADWIRWMRARRALTWTLRGFAVGLAFAIAVGLLGLRQAWFLRGEFLATVSAVALGTALLAGFAAYVWPIHPLRAARTFDRVFHLDERVSTALELNQNGTLPTRMIQQQLDDALASARDVQPRRQLPLRLKTLEGFLALVLALLLALVYARGGTWFTAASHQRAVQQAVDEQAEKIEEILKQIESNDALTEEQKRALSQPLEEALRGLQNNPSQEGAVSILTSTSEKLQALSDPQAQKISEALQNAGETLASQEGSPLEGVGQELAKGNAVNAATQLSQIDVSQLSPAEQEQLASQLETLANSVASTNPQLAAQLNQAAQALQNGDTAAAQQALDAASESLAQAGQQLTYSQTATQLATQMGQGAGQVLAAGGGQQAGAGTTPSGDNAGGAGSGRGSGGSDESGSGNEVGSSPIPQNNGAGDGGQSGYEQIYAPNLIGGENGENVNLPNSGEDGATVGEGPTDPGAPGASLVPYNEALPEYEAANQQAIESGAVPFEFIQIILDYFDSLTP